MKESMELRPLTNSLANTLDKLARYNNYLREEFASSLTRYNEYELNAKAKALYVNGQRPKRLVFTGMGCSAIVSYMIKGFFAFHREDLEIEILNDYDPTYDIAKSIFDDPDTLIIVSSYSGHSEEPIKAYEEHFKSCRGKILFLTSGGRLGAIAEADKMPVAYWRLFNPDREYPLLHAPQFFAILLDILRQINVISTNHQMELRETQVALKAYLSQEIVPKLECIAARIRNRDLTLVAGPKWYTSLLRLVQMHFNEVANHPTHMAPLHDFCHSEVAILNAPRTNHGILLFKDVDEDAYAEQKIANLRNLLTDADPANISIHYDELILKGSSFSEQMFTALAWIQEIVYQLGLHNVMPSRELISRAAGNSWYNVATIQHEIAQPIAQPMLAAK
jgi:glucose/mannose-6-phosphate isomerase